MARERPLREVPVPVILSLCCGLTLQILWQTEQPPSQAIARALPSPPRIDVLKVASLGEQEALGRVLMLWLQAFDNQPGISIPFRDLDYGHVIGWLDAILLLPHAPNTRCWPRADCTPRFRRQPNNGRCSNSCTSGFWTILTGVGSGLHTPWCWLNTASPTCPWRCVTPRQSRDMPPARTCRTGRSRCTSSFSKTWAKSKPLKSCSGPCSTAAH